MRARARVAKIIQGSKNVYMYMCICVYVYIHIYGHTPPMLHTSVFVRYEKHIETTVNTDDFAVTRIRNPPKTVSQNRSLGA